MKIGYIRIRTTHKNFIVERFDGKNYFVFNHWVEIKRFPSGLDGNILANELAMKLSGGTDYEIT